MGGATDKRPENLTASVSASSGALVRFLRRGDPLRKLPVPARYAIAIFIVLAALVVRYALGTAYPYPYLTFVLAVVLTSFILDRGSGFLATAFSAILAVYFFVEPRYSFELTDIGPVISVVPVRGGGAAVGLDHRGIAQDSGGTHHRDRESCREPEGTGGESRYS
jgi:K+-sensing histidine kinase KdpD